MQIRVNLTFFLCLSGVVCVASIRIRFTTTRRTGSAPFASSRVSSFLLSTWIIRLILLATPPSSLSTYCKGNVLHVTNGWCEYLRGFKTETRAFIGDSDDQNEFPTGGGSWERNIDLGSSTPPKMAKAVAGKGATMKRFLRNLLRPWPGFTKTHFWSFILAFLYRYDHHSMSITILTNKISWDKILFHLLFDLVSWILLCYMVPVYSMISVLDCSYLVLSRFCDLCPLRFDLGYLFL